MEDGIGGGDAVGLGGGRGLMAIVMGGRELEGRSMHSSQIEGDTSPSPSRRGEAQAQTRAAAASWSRSRSEEHGYGVTVTMKCLACGEGTAREREREGERERCGAARKQEATSPFEPW